MTDKFERHGQVAVLISKGFGAGWYTWSEHDEAMLFDPELVEAVLAKDLAKMHEIANRKFPNNYWGGIADLAVEWVPKDSKFVIHEYDGRESIWLQSQMPWITA